jgi:hypothetical protein
MNFTSKISKKKDWHHYYEHLDDIFEGFDNVDEILFYHFDSKRHKDWNKGTKIHYFVHIFVQQLQ